MKPTVGRIVHYVDPVSKFHCAAIVTRVHADGSVNLQVFGPDESDNWRVRDILEDNNHLAFTWHWPER